MSGEHASDRPSNTSFYRWMAAGMVLISGMIVFQLGIVIQVACCDYKEWVLNLGVEAPSVTL